MIEFRIAVKSPFRKENFKNIFSKTVQLSRNKFFEFEIIRYKRYLFEFNLDINWRGQDHAGPNLEIGIFGYSVCVRIYDSRHWNHIKNTWEVYNPED